MQPGDRQHEDVTLSADPAEGVVRLKAVGTFDEPVELSPEQARQLAQRLNDLADALD